jgi:hypothetical protein
VLGLLLAAPAAGQDRPTLRADLHGADPPAVFVSVEGLLAGDDFLDALRSGFPLYMEYRVTLRAPRSLWDRTVNEFAWEYVVVHDPVRDRFTVQAPGATEILPGVAELERRLAQVYDVGLDADQPGRYYYEARVEARTLSDDDVNEAFAWLKGGNADSAGRHDPGLLTRVARKMLIQVAPLPSVTLSGRTSEFVRR